MVVLVAILGFSTILPVNVGRPNFFGSFTLCSFVPLATVAMFILALTVYSFINKRKLLLYGSVSFLLVMVGFSGFWINAAKIPLDSVEMNITNVRFWIGEDPFSADGKPANLSSIFFDVTLYNPTSLDIPAFHSENDAIRINDRVTTPDIRATNIGLQTPLKAHATTSTERYIIFVEKYADPDVWASLLKKNFTCTISGILVVRYYYVPSSLPEHEGLSIVWASKPYSVSYTYTE